ncbi:MAG: Lrp/AsnC family transcriptional regulator [Actinomyces sp.]|nr:MAG: Lrp/AsnC family transcriptional regulator [Actinomyces sp.]
MRLDDINRLLLDELQRDARASYRELGERVGLTPPAVAERVRRMEREGIITGYHAAVDPAALGYPLLAIIRVHSPGARATEIDALAADMDEVVECHRVTGSESHVIRVRLRDMEHLNEVVERFWAVGETVTNIVTSTPVAHRQIPAGVAGTDA